MQKYNDISDNPMEAALKMTKLQAQLMKNKTIHKRSKHQTQSLTDNQEKRIHHLSRENRELTQKINAALSKIRPEFHQNIQSARQLREAHDKYDDLIQKEHKHMIKLDLRIMAMEERMTKQKAKRFKLVKDTERKIGQAEDNLQRAETKIAMMVIQKNKAKEKIKDLCSQKQSFYRAHQRMLQDYQLLKKTKNQLSEQTIHLHKDTVRLKSELKDQKKWTAERLAKLDQTIIQNEHEDKFQAFMDEKFCNSIISRSKIAVKERIEKRNAMAKEKQLKETLDTLKFYEENYNTLQTLTGKVDGDAIAQHFTKREVNNFGTFNRDLDLFDEEERLKRDIQVLHENITCLKTQKQNLSDKRESLRRELEENIHKTSEEANNYQDKFNQKCAIVDKCILAIDRLSKDINCEPKPFLRELEAKDLSYQESLNYFQAFEQQVSVLHKVHIYLTTKDKDDKEVSLGSRLGFSPYYPVCPYARPPNMSGDDASMPDNPLEYEEIRKITLDKIIQMEQTPLIARKKKLLAPIIPHN